MLFVMPVPQPVTNILRILKKQYPQANCALKHKNALELLVATILSAQCTDKRVNLVTPALFKRYKRAANFASANLKEISDLIRSTGFFRQKARWIQETCRIIDSKHNGHVPKTLEELTALPGVGRKTANVVMGNAFGIASGIVVDTHVKRISKRLGLTRATDPEKVEKDLVKQIPISEWIWFSHALIEHGRKLCKAVRPQCPQCPILECCPSRQI